MKVLLTDYQQADAEMECDLLLGAGIEVAVAQFFCWERALKWQWHSATRPTR